MICRAGFAGGGCELGAIWLTQFQHPGQLVLHIGSIATKPMTKWMRAAPGGLPVQLVRIARWLHDLRMLQCQGALLLEGGCHESCPVTATKIAWWGAWELPKGDYRRPVGFGPGGSPPLPVRA